MPPPHSSKNEEHSAPRYIQLETTTLCNATCSFCPQGSKSRSAAIMEGDVWKKIIDDTRGLGVTYRPFLLNEPFTDKRMPEIVSYIHRDPTAKVEFNTNGSLLSPSTARWLANSGISVIRFSLDGFTEETLKATRGLSRDQCYGGILDYIEQNRLSAQPAKVEVRMIDMPGNMHEHRLFREFWEPKVDLVEFTTLYRFPWTGQVQSLAASCPKVTEEMFFRWDGFAVLCCWDAAGRAKAGSVKERSVLEIWNGDELTGYRKTLDRGDRSSIELCSRCDAYPDLQVIRSRHSAD